MELQLTVLFLSFGVLRHGYSLEVTEENVVSGTGDRCGAAKRIALQAIQDQQVAESLMKYV